MAEENQIEFSNAKLFYYEVYTAEFNGKDWFPYKHEEGIETNILEPLEKKLEGYDVCTFWAHNSPECSPLSCNGLAQDIHVNVHCLFDTLDEAKTHLDNGAFNKGEPGPYRIFAIYSVDWP